MDKHKLFGFTNVDQSNDPDYYIRFLDEASADESFQTYKRHTFTLLDVRPGQHILDVGCGTGEDARAMAQLVAPGGRVVGVDGSQTMIATAKQRAEGCGLPVEFHTGDIHKLAFADESFDASRADRIFMHLDSPVQALREMLRVSAPGGRVLVYEVDFETNTVDVPDRIRRERSFISGAMVFATAGSAVTFRHCSTKRGCKTCASLPRRSGCAIPWRCRWSDLPRSSARAPLVCCRRRKARSGYGSCRNSTRQGVCSAR